MNVAFLRNGVPCSTEGTAEQCSRLLQGMADEGNRILVCNASEYPSLQLAGGGHFTDEPFAKPTPPPSYLGAAVVPSRAGLGGEQTMDELNVNWRDEDGASDEQADDESCVVNDDGFLKLNFKPTTAAKSARPGVEEAMREVQLTW